MAAYFPSSADTRFVVIITPFFNPIEYKMSIVSFCCSHGKVFSNIPKGFIGLLRACTIMTPNTLFCIFLCYRSQLITPNLSDKCMYIWLKQLHADR